MRIQDERVIDGLTGIARGYRATGTRGYMDERLIDGLTGTVRQ